MEPKDKYLRHTYSYLALRKAVGWIGILLPFTLMLGVFFIFKGEIIQKSISHYYHSGMGDVLVGALCAVALFMFFYSGHDKWDDRAGNVAAIFAIGVAWFPTTEVGYYVGIISRRKKYKKQIYLPPGLSGWLIRKLMISLIIQPRFSKQPVLKPS